MVCDLGECGDLADLLQRPLCQISFGKLVRMIVLDTLGYSCCYAIGTRYGLAFRGSAHVMEKRGNGTFRFAWHLNESITDGLGGEAWLANFTTGS